MRQASSSQPISLRPPSQPFQQQSLAADAVMASPSVGFDPASYTRAMLDSPMSWRASSFFDTRVYHGTPPKQLSGNFDLDTGKPSSSIESDHYMQTQNEFCRDYTCCQLNLSDLHALVDHFDEAHVVVIDRSTSRQPSLLPHQLPHVAAQYPQHAQHLPYSTLGPAPQPQSFDPADDMELDEQSPPSYLTTSPPCTPPYGPEMAFQVPYASAPYSRLSMQPPSVFLSPVFAFDTSAVLPSGAGAHQAYTDYAPYSSIAHDQARNEGLAVAPNMLFSRQVKEKLRTSKAAAHATPSKPTQQSPSPTGSAPPTPDGETMRTGAMLSHPAPSLLLSKRFRCPKPNCNKSYKQANGLKYHISHGSCSFTPPKDLEAVRAVLAEKGLNAESDLSESDVREVEREVERRLRPFVCAVGECTRRYKNMNGLRYHYQHSGEHGAVGLRLLASGQHECLQHHRGRVRKAVQAQAAAMTAIGGQSQQGAGTLVPVSQPGTSIVSQQQAQQEGQGPRYVR